MPVCIFNSADDKRMISQMQSDVNMTSLPVAMLLCKNSLPERVFLCYNHTFLEAFIDKLQQFQKKSLHVY